MNIPIIQIRKAKKAHRKILDFVANICSIAKFCERPTHSSAIKKMTSITVTDANPFCSKTGIVNKDGTMTFGEYTQYDDSFGKK